MSLSAVVAIVPAAGQSSRFGSMKLLADVGGILLLDRTLASLLDAGLERVVVVTSPAAELDRVRGLADPRVSVAINPDPSRGMFSSIQTGLGVMEAKSYLVLPADMPFVNATTVFAVAAHAVRAAAVVVPTFQGRRGHPISLPGALRAALLVTDPTSSLKQALALLGAVPADLAVADPGILADVDVPADLEAEP